MSPTNHPIHRASRTPLLPKGRYRSGVPSSPASRLVGDARRVQVLSTTKTRGKSDAPRTPSMESSLSSVALCATLQGLENMSIGSNRDSVVVPSRPQPRTTPKPFPFMKSTMLSPPAHAAPAATPTSRTKMRNSYGSHWDTPYPSNSPRSASITKVPVLEKRPVFRMGTQQQEARATASSEKRSGSKPPSRRDVFSKTATSRANTPPIQNTRRVTFIAPGQKRPPVQSLDSLRGSTSTRPHKKALARPNTPHPAASLRQSSQQPSTRSHNKALARPNTPHPAASLRQSSQRQPLLWTNVATVSNIVFLRVTQPEHPSVQLPRVTTPVAQGILYIQVQSDGSSTTRNDNGAKHRLYMQDDATNTSLVEVTLCPGMKFDKTYTLHRSSGKQQVVELASSVLVANGSGVKEEFVMQSDSVATGHGLEAFLKEIVSDNSSSP